VRILNQVPYLRVTDMARSLTFYVDSLGFNVVTKMEDEGRPFWARLGKDGAALMISSRPSRFLDFVEHEPGHIHDHDAHEHFTASTASTMGRSTLSRTPTLRTSMGPTKSYEPAASRLWMRPETSSTASESSWCATRTAITTPSPRPQASLLGTPHFRVHCCLKRLCLCEATAEAISGRTSQGPKQLASEMYEDE